MRLIELFLIAVGLSMDAFAVAVCLGLTMAVVHLKKALIVGLYFGFFQAAMPLAGYLLAGNFADIIDPYDNIVAFALLAVIGGKLILSSFKKEEERNACCTESGCDLVCNVCGTKQPTPASFGPLSMIPLAFATSVDALAVGASFAFLEVSILPAIGIIGVTTLFLSMAGMSVGSAFGAKLRSKAEFAGGLILIFIGVRLLLG
ncbi:MAG: manganese efflux pump MntP family protein [Oscillospiraceae bacterium]|nr:manganese efflux pump MntP family protein [Oscillospiraceae bacterium]